MKLTPIIASATVAAVLGTAGISIAGATSSGPSTAAPASLIAATNRTVLTRLPGGARRFVKHAVAIAAKTIGIRPADLVRQVRAGKTIADVANDHHVSPQAVVDALTKAATTRIDAAVTAGKITSERAARLEQRLPAVIDRLVNNWHPRARGHVQPGTSSSPV